MASQEAKRKIRQHEQPALADPPGRGRVWSDLFDDDNNRADNLREQVERSLRRSRYGAFYGDAVIPELSYD